MTRGILLAGAKIRTKISLLPPEGRRKEEEEEEEGGDAAAAKALRRGKAAENEIFGLIGGNSMRGSTTRDSIRDSTRDRFCWKKNIKEFLD